jgi:3',5'-cyclic-nucleotide phosphodiesterase
LDSGTLVNGLVKVFDRSAGDILANHIPTYLISHAHLDHYLGLVIAQPELRQHQTIMAREETMTTLLSHVFTWAIWGNFGDEGESPRLGFQHFQTLPLMTWQAIPGTDMQVKAFPLSHGNGFPSTAFLVRYDQDYVLYFGDTGADDIEKSQDMQAIWTEIAPIIRQKQLRGIFLECSFQNSQPNNLLFGHLTPTLYMNELHQLAATVNEKNPSQALTNLNVFITHVKPTVDSLGTNDTAEAIREELQARNDLGVNLILPAQGEHYIL